MSALSAASGFDSLAWNVFGTEQVHKGGQATIDTAALMSINLRALGESLAALSFSWRLFTEEEILIVQPELLKKENFEIENKKPSFKVKPDVVSDYTSPPEAPSRPAPTVSWNASLAGIETSALETESLFALSNDNTFPMKYEREEPENLFGVSHTKTVKVKFDAQTAEMELYVLLDMLDAPPPPINSCKVRTCGRATKARELPREDKNKFDAVISEVYMPAMDGSKCLELVGLEMDLPIINSPLGRLASEPVEHVQRHARVEKRRMG
ncbi:unnamed protein product [Sphagnum jensenii]|uniref:Uncharacterized protein n=1 Tax=Sphagnum jensenii TaxID=128206 RepID=A0ABP1AWP6_9BRYO